jgi:hypothetical protein
MLCHMLIKKKEQRAHELRITHLSKAPAFTEIKVGLDAADLIHRFSQRSDKAMNLQLPTDAWASMQADNGNAPTRRDFTLQVGSRAKELDIIFAGGALLPNTDKSVATYAADWKAQLLNTGECSTTFTLPFVEPAAARGGENASLGIDVLAAAVAAAADSDAHCTAHSAEVKTHCSTFAVARALACMFPTLVTARKLQAFTVIFGIHHGCYHCQKYGMQCCVFAKQQLEALSAAC